MKLFRFVPLFVGLVLPLSGCFDHPEGGGARGRVVLVTGSRAGIASSDQVVYARVVASDEVEGEERQVAVLPRDFAVCTEEDVVAGVDCVVGDDVVVIFEFEDLPAGVTVAFAATVILDAVPENVSAADVYYFEGSTTATLLEGDNEILVNTANLGSPVIEITGGNNQLGDPSGTLPLPFTVLVRGPAGELIDFAPVQFDVVTGDGSVSAPDGVMFTDLSSVASTTFTLGPVGGTNVIEASALGLPPLVFRVNPGTMYYVSGDSQTGTVNAPLTNPFVVEILDDDDEPVSGIPVQWVVTGGTGGSFSGGATVVTDISGQASNTYTPGTAAGSYTVEARVPGLDGSPVVFDVTADPGAPALIELVSGNSQTGVVDTALANAFVVRVRDQFNNVVPDADVDWDVTQSDGSLSGGATVATDANGESSNTLTLGTLAGTDSDLVEASLAQPVTGSPVVFTATATHGPADSIAYVSGDGQSATVNTALASNLVVVVADEFGNAVPGYSVGFLVTAGGGSLSATPPVTTDASGQAAIGLTVGTVAGTNNNSVNATAALTGSPVTFLASATADAATQIVEISGDGQTGTVAQALASPFVVEVRDQYDNPVSGYSIGFSVTAGGGSLSATPPLSTGTDGRASITLTLGTAAGTGNNSVSATASLTGSPITFTASANAGAPAEIKSVSGGGQSATVATALSSPFVVLVEDAYDNPVPSVTVNWAVTGGGGSIPATSSTNSSGNASATLTLGTAAGTSSNSATASLVPSVTGSPVTFTASSTAGAAYSINYISGDGQTATVATALTNPLVVEIRDQYGNPVSGTQVDFDISLGGGSLGTDSANSGTDGRASTTLTVGTVSGTDNQQVTAASAGLQNSPVTFTASVNPGTPNAITATAGTPQSATVAAAFGTALQARVTDVYGNGVPLVSVTFTSPGATNAQFAGPSLTSIQTTNATGYATAGTLTAGTLAGGYTATATAGALTANFSLTNNAGAPDEIKYVSGGSQSATVATALSSPFVVLVEDAYDNPVPGVTVNWAVTGSNGSIPATSSTNSSGNASATLTLGTTAGTDSDSATASLVPSVTGSPVTFTASATAGAPAKLVYVSGDSQSGSTDQFLASAFVVRVTDTYDNALAGVNLTWSVTGGGGAMEYASPTSTDAFGEGSNTLLIGSTPGTNNNTVNVAVTDYSVTGEPMTFTASALARVPTNLYYTSGDDQTGIVNTALSLPFTVQVTDEYDDPVQGYSVSFVVTGSNGSMVETQPVSTDSGGYASSTLTLGTTAGADSDEVTVTDVALSGSPVIFTASADPGPIDEIVLVAGNSQTATVTSAYATNLEVRVEDEFDNPINGANVNFISGVTYATFPTTPGASSDTSGTDGHAVAEVLTATTLAGTFQVSVSSGLVTEYFDLENTADVPDAIVYVDGDGFTGTVGQTYNDILVVRVDDQYANPVEGAGVYFAIADGPHSVIEDYPVSTDSDGYASASVGFATTLGSSEIEATTAGVADTVLFTVYSEADAPASLSAYSGDGQSGEPSATLPAPLVAVLEDQYGNPVDGVDVTFAGDTAFDTEGGLLTGSNPAATDVDGFVGIQVQLPGTVDDYTVTASAGALTADFTVTVASLADTDGDGIPDIYESNNGYCDLPDLGSDPNVSDTDDDGLPDGAETCTGIFVSLLDTGSDPNDSDTDSDLINDFSESLPRPSGMFDLTYVQSAINPLVAGAATGDFNNDSIQDVVYITGPGDSGGIYTLLGDGEGAFAAQGWGSSGSANPEVVLPGDFDGDGNLDAVVAGYDDTAIQFLQGLGSGDLAEGTQYLFTSGSDTGSPAALISHDLGYDSWKDLLVFYSNGNVSMLPGCGDPIPPAGCVSESQEPPFGDYVELNIPDLPSSMSAVINRDIDNDSYPDFVILDAPGGSLYWTEMEDPGNFGFSDTRLLLDGYTFSNGGSGISAFTYADLTGEGLDDLIVAEAHPNPDNGDQTDTTVWLLETASEFWDGPVFSRAVPLHTEADVVGAQRIDVADLNADGMNDVVITYGGAEPNVLVSDGRRPYGFTVQTLTGTGAAPALFIVQTAPAEPAGYDIPDIVLGSMAGLRTVHNLHATFTVDSLSYSSDPNIADTDDDGLDDGAEYFGAGTDPNNEDTDNDGLSDDYENFADLDPRHPDTDRDGLDDYSDDLQANATDFFWPKYAFTRASTPAELRYDDPDLYIENAVIAWPSPDLWSEGKLLVASKRYDNVQGAYFSEVNGSPDSGVTFGANPLSYTGTEESDSISIATSAHSQDVYLAVTESGASPLLRVFSSYDGGGSWAETDLTYPDEEPDYSYRFDRVDIAAHLNRVAVAVEVDETYDPNPYYPYSQIAVMVSDNRGVSWSDPVVTPGASGDYFPDLAISDEGNIALVYESGYGSAYITCSLDGGQTWQGDGFPDESLSIGEGYENYFDSQVAALPGGDWLVTMLSSSGEGDDRAVYTKVDRGCEWADSVSEISYEPGSQTPPRIAVSPDGYIYAVFTSLPGGGGGGGLDLLDGGGEVLIGGVDRKLILARGDYSDGLYWETVEMDFRSGPLQSGFFYDVAAGPGGRPAVAYSYELPGPFGNVSQIGVIIGGPDGDGDLYPSFAETGTWVEPQLPGVYVSPVDAGTDPFVPDWDGDGIPDGYELIHMGEPPDPDGDGIYAPFDWDSDDDDVADGDEVVSRGNGKFGSSYYGETGVSTAPTHIVTGDFTGDGAPDVIAYLSLAGSLQLFANDGDGDFGIYPSTVLGTSYPELDRLRTRDLNGDGILDVVSVLTPGGDFTEIYIYWGCGAVTAPGDCAPGDGNPNGLFSSYDEYEIGDSPDTADFDFIDWDGLNGPDIVVGDNGTETVSVLVHQGGTSYASAVQVLGSVSSTLVRVADVNRDGIDDIATAYSNEVTFLPGCGAAVNPPSGCAAGAGVPAGTVGDPVVRYSWSFGGLADFEFADFDGNMVPDMFVKLTDPYVGVSFQRGIAGRGDLDFGFDSNSGFRFESDYLYDSVSPDLHVTDLDGDRVPDFLTAYNDSGYSWVLVFHGAGVDKRPTGYFDRDQDLYAETSTFMIQTADFNGDGAVDIVTSDPNGDRFLFFPGIPVFQLQSDPLLTDSDGDGSDDDDEYSDGTDPMLADTDGDSISDSDELLSASDPLDPWSFYEATDNLVFVPNEDASASVASYGSYNLEAPLDTDRFTFQGFRRGQLVRIQVQYAPAGEYDPDLGFRLWTENTAVFTHQPSSGGNGIYFVDYLVSDPLDDSADLEFEVSSGGGGYGGTYQQISYTVSFDVSTYQLLDNGDDEATPGSLRFGAHSLANVIDGDLKIIPPDGGIVVTLDPLTNGQIVFADSQGDGLWVDGRGLLEFSASGGTAGTVAQVVTPMSVTGTRFDISMTVPLFAVAGGPLSIEDTVIDVAGPGEASVISVTGGSLSFVRSRMLVSDTDVGIDISTSPSSYLADSAMVFSQVGSGIRLGAAGPDHRVVGNQFYMASGFRVFESVSDANAFSLAYNTFVDADQNTDTAVQVDADNNPGNRSIGPGNSAVGFNVGFMVNDPDVTVADNRVTGARMTGLVAETSAANLDVLRNEFDQSAVENGEGARIRVPGATVAGNRFLTGNDTALLLDGVSGLNGTMVAYNVFANPAGHALPPGIHLTNALGSTSVFPDPLTSVMILNNTFDGLEAGVVFGTGTIDTTPGLDIRSNIFHNVGTALSYVGGTALTVSSGNISDNVYYGGSICTPDIYGFCGAGSMINQAQVPYGAYLSPRFTDSANGDYSLQPENSVLAELATVTAVSAAPVSVLNAASADFSPAAAVYVNYKLRFVSGNLKGKEYWITGYTGSPLYQFTLASNSDFTLDAFETVTPDIGSEFDILLASSAQGRASSDAVTDGALASSFPDIAIPVPTTALNGVQVSGRLSTSRFFASGGLSPSDGYYSGYQLTFDNGYYAGNVLTVTGYEGSTGRFTVDPSFENTLLVTRSVADAPPDGSTFQGDASLVDVDDFYNGQQLTFLDGPYTSSSFIVQDYVGATREFTLADTLNTGTLEGTVTAPVNSDTFSFSGSGFSDIPGYYVQDEYSYYERLYFTSGLLDGSGFYIDGYDPVLGQFETTKSLGIYVYPSDAPNSSTGCLSGLYAYSLNLSENPGAYVGLTITYHTEGPLVGQSFMITAYTGGTSPELCIAELQGYVGDPNDFWYDFRIDVQPAPGDTFDLYEVPPSVGDQFQIDEPVVPIPGEDTFTLSAPGVKPSAGAIQPGHVGGSARGYSEPPARAGFNRRVLAGEDPQVVTLSVRTATALNDGGIDQVIIQYPPSVVSPMPEDVVSVYLDGLSMDGYFEAEALSAPERLVITLDDATYPGADSRIEIDLLLAPGAGFSNGGTAAFKVQVGNVNHHAPGLFPGTVNAQPYGSRWALTLEGTRGTEPFLFSPSLEPGQSPSITQAYAGNDFVDGVNPQFNYDGADFGGKVLSIDLPGEVVSMLVTSVGYSYAYLAGLLAESLVPALLPSAPISVIDRPAVPTVLDTQANSSLGNLLNPGVMTGDEDRLYILADQAAVLAVREYDPDPSVEDYTGIDTQDMMGLSGTACAGTGVVRSIAFSRDGLDYVSSTPVGAPVLNAICHDAGASALALYSWPRSETGPSNANSLRSGGTDLTAAPFYLENNGPVAVATSPVSPLMTELILLARRTGDAGYSLLRIDQAQFNNPGALISRVSVPESLIQPGEIVKSMAFHSSTGTLFVLVQNPFGNKAYVAELSLAGELRGRWKVSHLLYSGSSSMNIPVMAIAAGPMLRGPVPTGDEALLPVRLWLMTDGGDSVGDNDRLVLVTIPR